MNTAERMVGGVNASRVARQALSWATREARLGQAPLLIVRDQPNAADAVGLDDQVQFSDSPNDLDPIEAVHAIEHRPGTNDQRDSPSLRSVLHGQSRPSRTTRHRGASMQYSRHRHAQRPLPGHACPPPGRGRPSRPVHPSAGLLVTQIVRVPQIDPLPAQADALLRDGRIVSIRRCEAADRLALRDLFERSSPASRYLRFFSAGASLEAEIERLLRIDPGHHLALAAEQAGIILGVASYDRIDDRRAELAIFVDDAWQGEGVGTMLLEHLSAAGRRAGIDELVGDVLTINAKMLKVRASLASGDSHATPHDAAVVRISIPTLPNDAALAAAGERDRTAEHRSLRPLLAPKSVAVIGAGRGRRRNWPRSAAGAGQGRFHGSALSGQPARS